MSKDIEIDKILDNVLTIYYHYPNIALYRTLEANLILHEKEKLKAPILDIGCLDAKFAKILFGNTVLGIDKIIGIDIDNRFIKKAFRSGIYYDTPIMSGEKMAFKDNTFNTVISNCVFEHVDDLYSLLRESYRVLNQGGILIATAHTSNISKILMEIYNNQSTIDLLNRKDHHVSLWAIEEYEKILEEIGYKDIKFERYGTKDTIRLMYKISKYYGFGGKYINLHNSIFFIGLLFKDIINSFQKPFLRDFLLNDLKSERTKVSIKIIAMKY